MKLRFVPLLIFMSVPLFAQLSITKTPITGGPKFPNSMTAGPDGNTWFTDFQGNTVGRLTPGGTVTTFPLPSANSIVDTITAGKDGNLWFTEDAGRIGRITPSGAITEFPVGNAMNPTSLITAGADGALWFLDQPSSFPPPNVKLARITTAGAITTYDLGSRDTIVGILTGPDGNIWYYDVTKNAMMVFDIGKGVIAATHPVPSPAGDFTSHLVLAPDGNLWFTHGNSVSRMKLDGTVTDYLVPTANAQPSAIAVGGDSNIWFDESQANKVGQLILSTATDSGRATINESAAVLDAGAIEMVPVGKRSPAMAGKTSVPNDSNDPCLSQTFVHRFTVAGIWYYVSWTVPSEKQCADLTAYVDLGDLYSRSGLPAGAAARVKCQMFNLGPATANNATLFCRGGGVLLNPTLKGDSVCKIASTGLSSVTITALTLGRQEQCTFESNISSDGSAVWNAYVESDSFDPDETNNTDAMQWDVITGSHYLPAPHPVIIPVLRGSRS
jgi:streptogramin lyase